ncbi:carbohydrate porin, partial [Defluviimonas sp. D31]|uniref:carbohydrate porin n=1 Tax=Defluviimonas sp. D31 TaxID=3083253 RepID=UPI00296EB099
RASALWGAHASRRAIVPTVGDYSAATPTNFAPGLTSSRDQYTVEAFYRYDVTDFLQITPQLQYVANPANDPTTDSILVLGLRLRVAF